MLPLGILGIIVAQLVEKVLHIHVGADLVGIASDRTELHLRHVVLVPDLADQLFEYVLHGHDAHRAAVVVRDDREGDLPAVQLLEQLVDGRALVHEARRVEQAAQLRALPLAQIHADVFADLQYADNVVDAPLVHGQAAVALLTDEREDLLRRRIHIERRNVHAGREHALDRHVAELQRRVDKLRPFLGQLALVGHRFDDVVQLILGHGDLRLALGERGKELADARERLRQRRENAHKKAQGRRRRKGAPFTVALGDALGKHLSGKKHRDRAHDRTKRHPARAPGARNEHRCERSGGDVDDIRADEDRGNCAVKIVLYVKSLLRLPVALVEPRSEPDAADGRCRRFRCGKICRCAEQQ